MNRALVVEVSDAAAVGVVTVPLGPSLAEPLNVVADQVVGVAEGSPIAVVVAHATGDTTAVRADFAAGGQDVMSVVAGWAVLVHPLASARALPGSAPKALGVAAVYALSGTGSVLERAVLPGSGALAMAVGACEGSGGNHKTSGSGSIGSAGSGSAGTGLGSASPGSTGSAGSTSAAPSDKPVGG